MILNRAAFLKVLDAEEARITRLFRQRVRRVVSAAMHELLRRTPVWTGSAAASYAIAETVRHPGFAPTPGTNEMKLGDEPNRPAAEAVSLGRLAAVDYTDPFQLFTITNGAKHMAELEYGLAPDAERSRAPAGQFRITNETILAQLRAGKL